MIRTRIRTLIRWTGYPALLALVSGTAFLALRLRWDLPKVYGLTILALVVGLGILETLFPLRAQWRMTRRTFFRDLKFIAAGSLTIGLVNGAFGLLALHLADRGFSGPLSGAPLWASVPLALLVFEGMEYLYHRASHELQGRTGQFLWRVHAAHHLPEQVNVLMHAAAHPLNALITRALMLLPLTLLGLSPEAVFLFNLADNFAGIVSHCNLDLRAGWLNYLIVGPELHRFHHSADPAESKNYGTVTPLFDLVHGTFVYKPGVHPERIGVEGPEAYPHATEVGKVLALPFHAWEPGAGREGMEGA